MRDILKAFLLLVLLVTLASCGGATLAQKKDESDIHYRLGIVHLNEGDVTGALRELTRAVEIYPDDPSYRNALGLAYLARGMNVEAKAEMKKAIELKSD